MSPEHRQALTQRLVSHLDGVLVELAPRVLAFCWPYRAEPDLRSWVQAWLAEAGVELPSGIAGMPELLKQIELLLK